MQFSIFSTLALALAVSAKVIQVEVAEDGFSFTPNTISAAVGDQVAFTFNGNGHNVAQGNFGAACQPYKTNPFFSISSRLGSFENPVRQVPFENACNFLFFSSLSSPPQHHQ